jgi:hypothetical protein
MASPLLGLRIVRNLAAGASRGAAALVPAARLAARRPRRRIVVTRRERAARAAIGMPPQHPERIARELRRGDEAWLARVCEELWPGDEYAEIAAGTSWLQGNGAGITPAQAAHQARSRWAAAAVLARRIVTALRWVTELGWRDWVAVALVALGCVPGYAAGAAATWVAGLRLGSWVSLLVAVPVAIAVSTGLAYLLCLGPGPVAARVRAWATAPRPGPRRDSGGITGTSGGRGGGA